MSKAKTMKEFFFVGMPNSIHTARWLSQFEKTLRYRIHVFPATPANWHQKILANKNLILHNFTYPGSFRFLNVSSEIIQNTSLEIEKLLKEIKPKIIHTLQIQHAAYYILPLKMKYGHSFPLWFCSAWGGDIAYYGQLEHHQEKTRYVLENIDALLSGDLLSINKARELYNFNKPILHVPSPGGSKIDECRSLVDFIKPSQRKNIVVKGYQGGVHRPETTFKALEMCAEDIKSNQLSVIIYIPVVNDSLVNLLINKGINVIKFQHTENYNDVLIMFASARINLASSITDGVPNSMLEGMVMGAFPIQSNSGSTIEYVNSGENGFLLDPMDINGFAEKIKIAIYDNDLVDSAVGISYKLMKSKIDYKKTQRKVLNFYRTRLNRRRNEKWKNLQ